MFAITQCAIIPLDECTSLSVIGAERDNYAAKLSTDWMKRDCRCWCWYLAKVPGSWYRVLVGASKYDPILRQDILGQFLIVVHVHHVACCQDTSQAIP